MIGLNLRAISRKVRWLGRLVGLFLAFFTYELLSKHYHTDYFGAADPYAGAVLAYLIGGWVVTFIIVWFFGSLIRNLSRLFGRS